MKREKKIKEEKTLNERIIDEAVKAYKNGTIKCLDDVDNFLKGLLQPMIQTLVDAELDNHWDFQKYERNGDKTNYRNGHCKPKKVETKYGEVSVSTPRDRLGTFTPLIIEKGQKKATDFEDKCISLYAKGMSLRDIEAILKDLYGVDINKDAITRLISRVNEEVVLWQNRPLKRCYTFTYADCLYVPIKDDVTSEKKAVYVIIGVDVYGMKEILGLWIDNTESASFWTGVFEELKMRGVEDILYMTSDGVAGFQGSLEMVFPKTNAQRCVVHLDRNIAKVTPKKELKEVMSEWKKIYKSSTLEEAELNLENFKEKFSKNSRVVEKATNFMQYIEPLFELPMEIRKVIYTSNAVESVNSALRKVTRGKGSFPSRESVFKVLYLRIIDLQEKWTKPIKNWNIIQSQLIEIFKERYTQYLDI